MNKKFKYYALIWLYYLLFSMSSASLRQMKLPE